MIATGVLVAGTVVTTIVSYAQKPQPLKAYTSPLLIVFLGSLTLLTKNPLFLVWKPTIMYLATSGAVLVGRLFYQTSLIERSLKLVNIHVQDYPWKNLDYGLALLFLMLAIANLFVYKTFGLDIWVQYKIYSLLGIMIILMPIFIHIESKIVKHEAS